VDWALVSALGALVTAIAGLVVAVSTRRKDKGDAALSITSAAEKAVAMREKDITALAAKVETLTLYVEYLHQWIQKHSRAAAKPVSLDEFVRRRAAQEARSPTSPSRKNRDRREIT